MDEKERERERGGERNDGLHKDASAYIYINESRSNESTMLNFPFVLEAIRNSRMMFDNISAVLILKSIGQILVQYLLCTFSINWWELEIVRIDFVDWILGRLLHWMDINCIDIAIKWSSVCNVSGQTASVNNVQWIWISVSLGKWFEDTGLITEFNGWTKWTRSAHSIPFVPLSLSVSNSNKSCMKMSVMRNQHVSI